MVTLRGFQPEDLDALYAISLATGHAGGDAAHLYGDPHMIGHIYSAPYAELEPSLVLVAMDADGVAGFIAGVLDTEAWEAALDVKWWPALRRRYADPGEPATTWSADQRRASMIHHPARTPHQVVAGYPAHLHLNLLPRIQGRGIGTALLEQWRDLATQRGARPAHVGVNSANAKGLGFWRKQGFTDLPLSGAEGRTIWLGRA